MSHLVQKIKELHQVSEALEPNKSQRTNYVNDVSAYANDFINDLKDAKAFTSAKELPNAFQLSKEKKTLSELLKIYAEEIANKGIKPASGGHLGYIPGGGIYTSAIADFLVDVTNEYVGMHFSCPGGVAIEHVVLDWMKDMFGFPTSAVGNLTSGGSIANLIAMTAARDKHKIKNYITVQMWSAPPL